MQHRAEAFDDSRQTAQNRGADPSAPRFTPLTLVADAVAGDDLEAVATAVARALACPVAIAIPALGAPIVAPAGSLGAREMAAVALRAAAIVRGDDASPSDPLLDAVPVRIGDQGVGVVAAVDVPDRASAGGAREEGVRPAPERRAWLDAAAAAASVAALLRGADAGWFRRASEALLRELAAGPPGELAAIHARARRLGVDLSGGAVAICARGSTADDAVDVAAAIAGGLAVPVGTLLARGASGRILAVAALAEDDPAARLVASLRSRGLVVAMSGPRRDPALLHDAICEAALLAELPADARTPREANPAAQDETYRLLIGVLLRDPNELRQLRDTTITPLADYDAGHDTELVDTLRTFLAHDGSTTETAETMSLHRHTVGYRLSRVHEVSGLSPYESDGRERLSLGIKAHQLLEAQRRLEGAEPDR